MGVTLSMFISIDLYVMLENELICSIFITIELPAGILQGIFFSPNRPKYMNFGGIGFIIGHELTHGFDDEGRQYDSKGDLLNWWKASTESQFLERAQCMINQYGNFTEPSTGLSVLIFLIATNYFLTLKPDWWIELLIELSPIANNFERHFTD